MNAPEHQPIYEAPEKVAKARRQECLLSALGRLQQNEDFKVFVGEALLEPFLDQRDANDDLQGENLVRGQGQSRVYREILRLIGESPRNFERLRVQSDERRRGVRDGITALDGSGAY